MFIGVDGVPSPSDIKFNGIGHGNDLGGWWVRETWLGHLWGVQRWLDENGQRSQVHVIGGFAWRRKTAAGRAQKFLARMTAQSLDELARAEAVD